MKLTIITYLFLSSFTILGQSKKVIKISPLKEGLSTEQDFNNSFHITGQIKDITFEAHPDTGVKVLLCKVSLADKHEYENTLALIVIQGTFFFKYYKERFYDMSPLSSVA